MTGKRVDVYRNLNKDCYSIKSMETGSDDYGTVIEHADRVLVEDPEEFVVQPAGLADARESGVKNVHAFVRGTLQATGDAAQFGTRNAWRLRYKPLDDTYRDLDRPFVYDARPRGRPVDVVEDPGGVLFTGIGAYGLYDVLPQV